MCRAGPRVRRRPARRVEGRLVALGVSFRATRRYGPSGRAGRSDAALPEPPGLRESYLIEMSGRARLSLSYSARVTFVLMRSRKSRLPIAFR